MSERRCRYVYGPVPSRRLGHSLGIDLVPFKTCSYDCIYCQLGRTTNKTIKREEYAVIDDVLAELDRKLSEGIVPDYISLAGSGEPTLNIRIGELIGKIKKMTRVPVAVLTNGSLLWLTEVREALMEADVVLPSLDAGDNLLFRHVNRPHKDISFNTMLQGLIDFTHEFPGSVWLEVFLIDGVTGILSEVDKISTFIRRIRPGKVHLNTVARPPAESFAFPVPWKQMKQFASVLGSKAEVINEGGPGDLSAPTPPGITGADILDLLSRRPCTVQDVSTGLGLPPPQVSKKLQELLQKGSVKTARRDSVLYFEAVRSR
ncbi:MAG: hypothetical protein QG657_4307 [Acidobacteriota bacterium]|nr:hypothetical protein [Acidobacteriota bacterium]